MKMCATEDFDACVEIKGTGIRDRVRWQDTPTVKKRDTYLDNAFFFLTVILLLSEKRV